MGGGGGAEDGEREGGWQRASHVGLLNHRPAEGRKGGWVGKRGSGGGGVGGEWGGWEKRGGGVTPKVLHVHRE